MDSGPKDAVVERKENKDGRDGASGSLDARIGIRLLNFSYLSVNIRANRMGRQQGQPTDDGLFFDQ